MKRLIGMTAVLLLVLSTAAYAAGRPHEGKIVRIDPDARVMTVQGEHGDQWDLYWDETTKLKNNLTFTELREGDSIHFDFVDKDGRMYVTELRRTHRAKE
jgi:Cu/Ag efflux protein CusF